MWSGELVDLKLTGSRQDARVARCPVSVRDPAGGRTKRRITFSKNTVSTILLSDGIRAQGQALVTGQGESRR